MCQVKSGCWLRAPLCGMHYLLPARQKQLFCVHVHSQRKVHPSSVGVRSKQNLVFFSLGAPDPRCQRAAVKLRREGKGKFHSSIQAAASALCIEFCAAACLLSVTNSSQKIISTDHHTVKCSRTRDAHLRGSNPASVFCTWRKNCIFFSKESCRERRGRFQKQTTFLSSGENFLYLKQKAEYIFFPENISIKSQIYQQNIFYTF